MPIRRFNAGADEPRVDRMSRADLEVEVRILRGKVFDGTRQRDLERAQRKIVLLERMVAEAWVSLPHYTMDTVYQAAEL